MGEINTGTLWSIWWFHYVLRFFSLIYCIYCIRMVPNSSELSINIDFLSEYFLKSLKII